MGIFSKTTAAPTKVVKVSADSIGLEIDKLTKSFTTIVTKRNDYLEFYFIKDPHSKPSLYRKRNPQYAF